MPKGRNITLFLLLLLILPGALGLACVGISQGANWNDVDMEKGVESFFSTRIYNSSSSGGYCDEGNYGLKLELASEEFTIDDIFEYEIKPEEMFLDNGENNQVLVTLTPKVSTGRYTVLIIAMKKPAEVGGTAIISTATAKLTVLIGNNPDPAYTEVPFWTMRKDCPGGFVVKKGEQCPSGVCKDNSLVYGDDLCPDELEELRKQKEAEGKIEEETIQTGLFGLAVPSLEMIVAVAALVIAVAAVAGSFLYIKKLKKELRGGLR